MSNRKNGGIVTEDIRGLFQNFCALQTQLKDLETHLGYLLGIAVRAWRSEESVHLTKSHYTPDGIIAEIYLPFDKRTYTIEIKEKK